jgi:predicted nuclease with TOPRIM domain
VVNCPKCGFSAITPIKTWPIPSRRPLRKGEETRLAGIFECPHCKARFRAGLELVTKTEQTVSIKDMVGRIKGIKEELMLTLVNLREKIKRLEIERANLMSEIENLREVAESKANALENEVSMLKEEARSLKDLLENVDSEKE